MAVRVDRRRVLIGTAAAIAAGPTSISHLNPALAQTEAVTVVASGLTNPRGFTWAEDGTMYVGLAGDGVTAVPAATPGASDAAVNADGTPVVAGAGETFVGTETASVVVIEGGCPATLASGFPSGGPPELGWDLGVDHVEILDGQLYALVGGGGEAYGHPGFPNGVYQVNADGSHALVADLSAWFRANPVAEPHPPVSPDAQPFSMVAIDGKLWIVEANHQQVLTVTQDGAITRIADLSVLGNLAPAGIAPAPDGGVYVGFLSPLPFADGSARVVKVGNDGAVTDVWTGLTTVTAAGWYVAGVGDFSGDGHADILWRNAAYGGSNFVWYIQDAAMVTAVAVDADGVLYALEMATGNTDEAPYVAPGTGKIVRQTGPDSSEDVLLGLDFPIKMAFGPDGALYVGLPAFGATDGQGQILRVDLAADGLIDVKGPFVPATTCLGATGRWPVPPK